MWAKAEAEALQFCASDGVEVVAKLKETSNAQRVDHAVKREVEPELPQNEGLAQHKAPRRGIGDDDQHRALSDDPEVLHLETGQVLAQCLRRCPRIRIERVIHFRAVKRFGEAVGIAVQRGHSRIFENKQNQRDSWG